MKDMNLFKEEISENLPDKLIFKEMGLGGIDVKNVMSQLVKAFKLDEEKTII